MSESNSGSAHNHILTGQSVKVFSQQERERIADSLGALLESGKKKGYLTYSQVIDHLPDDDANPEKLDQLLLLLEDQGIELIDESEVEEREAELEEAIATRRSLERSHNRKLRQLRLVKLCQSIPASERILRRSDLWLECGYVYLMEKLTPTRDGRYFNYASSPNSPHKIGATNRPLKLRIKELWNDKRLILCEKYPTVVAFALEEAIHRHFDDFRIRRKGQRRKGERKNQKGEQFRLPPDEVAGFRETVVKVERWVLAIEEARLELEISRMKTSLR